MRDEKKRDDAIKDERTVDIGGLYIHNANMLLSLNAQFFRSIFVVVATYLTAMMCISLLMKKIRGKSVERV